MEHDLIDTKENEFLFVEKYRPQKVADCILPANIKKTFLEIVAEGTLPNLILSGTAGLGKTTIAKALCNELGLDFLLVNGSEEGNIDTLRGKIKKFASSVSLQGGYKVVILDEADYLNAQSAQPALRGFIEEFSANCRFILTCNFKNRIIDPLHSRCTTIDFIIPKKSQPQLASQFMNRCKVILDAEGVTYDESVIAEVILKYLPDWRKVLNELQRYSVSGTIDSGILVSLSDESVKKLMKHLKDKNFKAMRSWVAENLDNDSTTLYRNIYDNASTYVAPSSVPQLILILADYSYKNAFVADIELNTVACFTELMANIEYV